MSSVFWHFESFSRIFQFCQDWRLKGTVFSGNVARSEKNVDTAQALFVDWLASGASAAHEGDLMLLIDHLTWI